MEAMIKTFQKKIRKMKEDMNRWDELQSRLVSQFRNASSIIERLQAIQNLQNFGSLVSVEGIEVAVLQKQMESLQSILLSMNKTMEEFRLVVLSLEKVHRDAIQLVKWSSKQEIKKRLQHKIGLKPSLGDCLEGLKLLHEMHLSEYLLKTSLVSALSRLAIKPNANDLGALHQILVDQPNIPREEVTNIFQIILAEGIC